MGKQLRTRGRAVTLCTALTLGVPLSGTASAHSLPHVTFGPTTLAVEAPVREDAQTQNPTQEKPQAKPQDQPPPQPRHTGLQALVRTTGEDFVAFPRRRSTWVILGLGAALAAASHPVDDDLNARLVGNRTVSRIFTPGKYIGLGSVQAAAAVGTYLVGRYVLPHDPSESPQTNKVSHIGFDLVRATIVTQTLTHVMKVAVRRDRPDGQCCAFPSGHASTTFATAAVLERHFGVRGAWPTMLVATYVAASRLHDNRHFLSDVVFGAALGTASGWTVVGRHGRSQFAMYPVPQAGGVAIVFVRNERDR